MLQLSRTIFFIPKPFLLVKRAMFSILKMNFKEWSWQFFITICCSLLKNRCEKVFKDIEWTWYSSHLVYNTHAESYSEDEELQTRKQKTAAATTTTTTKTTKRKIRNKRKLAKPEVDMSEKKTDKDPSRKDWILSRWYEKTWQPRFKGSCVFWKRKKITKFE